MSHILTRWRDTICVGSPADAKNGWHGLMVSITDERNPLQTSRDGAGPDIILRADPEIADPPEHG